MENVNVCAGLIATTPEEAKQLLSMTEKLISGKEETNPNGYIIIDDTKGTVLDDTAYVDLEDAVAAASQALYDKYYDINEDCVAIYGLVPAKTVELVVKTKIEVSNM